MLSGSAKGLSFLDGGSTFFSFQLTFVGIHIRFMDDPVAEDPSVDAHKEHGPSDKWMTASLPVASAWNECGHDTAHRQLAVEEDGNYV